MGLINVKTGFGYYTDSQGHIILKAELPKGEHLISNDLEYIEVAGKAELDAVEVHRDPAEIQKAQDEQKIKNKIRQIAITALKSDGVLPQDFV